MKARWNYAKVTPGLYEAMDSVDAYLASSALERTLCDLVRLRISQINGCAYCVDMHWKDLRALGETEQRLYGLDAWEESGYYSPRERAALAWAEAVNNLHEGHVSDAAYEAARAELSSADLALISLVVAQINSWNRLSIASRLVAGTYTASVA
jgi:AhpD family alkylhydroperoxidase